MILAVSLFGFLFVGKKLGVSGSSQVEVEAAHVAVLKVVPHKAVPEEVWHRIGVLSVLKQSHEIFHEVWGTLNQDRFTKKASVFSELLQAMQKTYRDDGTSYSNSPDKSVVYENGKFVREEQTGRGPSRQEIGVLEKLSPNTWRFRLFAKYFSAGLGLSLSVLGSDINCEAQLGEKFQLQKLDCQNLGQNLDSDRFVKFEKFQYASDQSLLVEVEASVYKNLGTVESKKNMRVPMEGKIALKTEMLAEPEVEIAGLQQADSGDLPQQNQQQNQQEEQKTAATPVASDQPVSEVTESAPQTALNEEGQDSAIMDVEPEAESRISSPYQRKLEGLEAQPARTSALQVEASVR